MVWVDIPQQSMMESHDGAYLNVAKFKTRQEAIAFAREHFGADENGMVCLISGSDEEFNQEGGL